MRTYQKESTFKRESNNCCASHRVIDAMDQKPDPSRVLRKRIKRYGLIGGLMAGIGGLICLGFPKLVDTGLKSQMQIKEGNDITKNWENVN